VDTEPAWTVTALKAEEDALTIELQAAPLRTLEWYVSALDATGAVVGHYGTAQEPQRHYVPETSAQGTVIVERETPRLYRWPAYVALGLGIVAEVLGAVFELNSQATVRKLNDRTMPPGDWAYTYRDAYSGAVRDATVATALFVVGGVAGSVGVLVFAW
jgi:hypothetical protein